jgi:tetratricopeptide (TPR) repeat protein
MATLTVKVDKIYRVCRTVMVLMLVVGCNSQGESESKPATSSRTEDTTSVGHQAMLETLNEIHAAGLQTDPFLGTQQVDVARRRLAEIGLAKNAAHRQRVDAVIQVANQQLRLGQVDQAIEHYAEARQTLPKIVGKISDEDHQRYLFQIAIGYLRMAESENCVHCQTGESCILPIRGGGEHDKKVGSTEAIEVLSDLLELNPDHLTAKWLLNIASMTLGQYPNAVPDRHRIDPAKFAGEDFPRFSNVAKTLGLATLSLSGGVIADDFTGNGAIDLVVSDWSTRGQLRLFANDGSGKFVDQTTAAGLSGIYGGLNLVQADYNNDGNLDILVLRGAWRGTQGRHPNSLLRNDGGGRFTDVTFETGLGDVHYPTQTAAWYDINKDGYLDLYIGNEDFPSQLFVNDGSGSFQDIARQAGVTNDRYAKAVSWGDFDNDGHVDLYVSNYGSANRLYRNNGDNTFTDVAAESGVEAPHNGFAAWFWDFDNDGRLDIFAASYNMSVEDVAASYFDLPVKGELACLYKGSVDGNFTNVAGEMGLTTATDPMGANFGDLDNDGYLDFYLGTGYPAYESLMPNVMYHNREGKRFADITFSGGFGHLQKGHGIAFADFRGSGENDVFIELGGAYPGDAFTNGYFLNPGFGNRSIRIKLRGSRSNRDGIGAKIQVDFTTDGKAQTVYRWVNSDGSFGANPLIAHVGVGKAERVRQIKVTWPATGLDTVVKDVAVDGKLIVVNE